MLVCHCKAVNDRRIREEISRGARDEFDIASACGAGGVCGGCLPAIGAILAEAGSAAMGEARDLTREGLQTRAMPAR